MKAVETFVILSFVLFLTFGGLRAEVFSSFKNCLLESGVGSGNIVRRSNSKQYNDLNYQWQQRRKNIRPLAFILVRTEKDVVASVLCGRHFNVSMVALGGGHSNEKYSFGDEHSVVIDLQLLNDITLNSLGQTATVGAGALNGPIVMTLWNRGRVTFQIPNCQSVGIVGLATGGGNTYLSRTYGLTSDFILSLRIVTADGQLRAVSKDVNSDLYWALRGGGASSFGIVTSLTFKTVPAPPIIFVENLKWNLSNFVKVFEAWQNFALHAPRTISGKLNIANGTILGTFIDLTGTGFQLELIQKTFPPPEFKSHAPYSYPDFLIFAAQGYIYMPNGFGPQDLLNVTRHSAIKQYESLKSFYVQKLAGHDDLARLRSLLLKVPPTVTLFFHPYGGAINDVKVHETAYVHRKGRYAIAGLTNMANPRNPSETAADVWLTEIFELSKKVFNHHESYQNYGDGDLSDHLKRYYGSNLPRLVQVKQKFDPDNYFNNPQSIPTKI